MYQLIKRLSGFKKRCKLGTVSKSSIIKSDGACSQTYVHLGQPTWNAFLPVWRMAGELDQTMISATHDKHQPCYTYHFDSGQVLGQLTVPVVGLPDLEHFWTNWSPVFCEQQTYQFPLCDLGLFSYNDCHFSGTNPSTLFLQVSVF